jgi:hypothetical protein
VTIDVSPLLPYGPLERTEVYFEHDGPRFFSLRSLTFDVRVLAICIDEDESAAEVSFLYLAMSVERFAQVRGGRIGLRDAFMRADPWTIWSVTENYAGDVPSATAHAVRFKDIPDADLPRPEARMDLATETAPALTTSELSQLSARTLRTVAAIELDAVGQHTTEFPLKGLGLVSETFQETVDALAQEEIGPATEFGPIAASATVDVQMSVYGLRAASFALVLATDTKGGMIDNAPKVEATLSRLVELLESGHDSGTLVTAMRGYGARARSKFTGLLRSVAAHGSGLGVAIAPGDKPVRAARLSSLEVVRALAAIDAVEPMERSVHATRGVLQGSNTRRSTFELVDLATTYRYSGKVSPEAQTAIDGLRVGSHSYIAASLLEQVDFGADDQETGRTYTLLSISAIAEG